MKNIWLFLSFCGLNAFLLPGFAADWNVENIAYGTGQESCIALDQNNNAHFVSSRDSGLYYTRPNGAGWITERVDDCYRFPTQKQSMAFTGDGRPCIAYTAPRPSDRFRPCLKYASWDGSNWQTEIIDDAGNVGLHISLAVDAEGNPHISYVDADNKQLMYASWNGQSWTKETIDSGTVFGYGTSLVLDDFGRPCISYTDPTRHKLMYGYWDGQQWRKQTVEDSGRPVLSNLALDANGTPYIGYLNYDGDRITLARFNGQSWTKEVVDSLDNNPTGVSFTLDAIGSPHFAYVDPLGNRIKYATRYGDNWVYSVIGPVLVDAATTDIVVDAFGTRHVSYYNRVGATMTLVYATNIPEPSSLLALLCGVAGVGGAIWRRRW